MKGVREWEKSVRRVVMETGLSDWGLLGNIVPVDLAGWEPMALPWTGGTWCWGARQSSRCHLTP